MSTIILKKKPGKSVQSIFKLKKHTPKWHQVHKVKNLGTGKLYGQEKAL